ncbi:alpha/beta hydrolase [Bradyrhizobium japonicum]|uniref:alpha/beta hydrolase n=1 Tax=Bradyrhizobium japonicum TaxID=375 RepID=UPI001BA9302C|nr:alpha/beta hydrolase-fold protein [Bradyrhizobium japonicum]MBR0956672.1 alpha/beta hydrolase [Bradyrhizobium japonicum]
MAHAMLPGASVRDMRSTAGHDYRIFVWQPEPRPRESLPVLYLLDGNGMFPIAVATLALQSRRTERTGVSPSVIVGIGYPTVHWIDAKRRTYDYTPLVAADRLPRRPGNRVWDETGGADAFLDFIQCELAPAISDEFAIDPDRTALFGHSFGGLFGLYALLTRPTLVRSYVAASPSIWFAPDALAERLKAFAAPSLAPRRVLVTVGSLEQGGMSSAEADADDYGSWLRRNRMVDNAHEFVAALTRTAAASLDVSFRTFGDENHASVVPSAISLALRFALPPK